MQKIATPHELQSELRAIIALATDGCSRARMAIALTDLADRVAAGYSRCTVASSAWKAKRITDQDVKHRAQLYWSPRQRAYDPTMMGNSSARTLAPLLSQSFALDLASEFYFHRWNQDQAKSIEESILASEHPNAKNIARHVGLDVFNAHGGSQYPSAYWDIKYSGRLKDLHAVVPQLNEMGMEDAATKIKTYLDDVEKIRKATEGMIEKSIMSGLKKMGLDEALIGSSDS